MIRPNLLKPIRLQSIVYGKINLSQDNNETVINIGRSLDSMHKMQNVECT